MRKKLISFLLLMMICIGLVPNYSFAANKKEGKIIYISINRTNLDNLQEIPVLNKKLKSSGYVGLMNIKGDQGNDDERSYASIGAGCRANVESGNAISFINLDEKNGQIFKSVTGVNPKEINNININKSININTEKGSFGSVLGLIGQTLSDNNKTVSLLGNSDIVDGKGNVVEIRNAGLIAMDTMGRVDKGNIDNINMEDLTMPYGIRTDYSKLAK